MTLGTWNILQFSPFLARQLMYFWHLNPFINTLISITGIISIISSLQVKSSYLQEMSNSCGGQALCRRETRPCRDNHHTLLQDQNCFLHVFVHSLSTLILMHTSRPTPHEMGCFSRQLVQKYPKLRDTVDSGNPR